MFESSKSALSHAPIHKKTYAAPFGLCAAFQRRLFVF
jgi:hypothetical protein